MNLIKLREIVERGTVVLSSPWAVKQSDMTLQLHNKMGTPQNVGYGACADGNRGKVESKRTFRSTIEVKSGMKKKGSFT